MGCQKSCGSGPSKDSTGSAKEAVTVASRKETSFGAYESKMGFQEPAKAGSEEESRITGSSTRENVLNMTQGLQLYRRLDSLTIGRTDWGLTAYDYCRLI